MRTTVRETLFSNVMLDPNRQREMVFYPPIPSGS